MIPAAYDAIADWYDRSIRERTLLSASDRIASALFETISDVDGLYLCDLACGQGHMARQLARRGARMVGVDLSQKLLEIAQRDEDAGPLGIVYCHDDAQSLSSLGDTLFDGVVCNLALMDIPDLAATLRSAQRILRPGGWFAAAITHPCFQIPPGRRYDDEGFWLSDNPHGVRGQVGAHHRTLSTYLNSLTEVGLILQRLVEPLIPDRETPPILVMHAAKPSERRMK